MNRSPLKRRSALRTRPKSITEGAPSMQEHNSLFCCDCGAQITVQAKTGRCRSCSARRSATSKLPVDAPRDKYGLKCVEVACAVCGGSFLTPLSGVARRKTCSRKCRHALLRARGGEDRKGAANPNFKTGARVGVRDRAGEARWYAALVDYCMDPACTNPKGYLALHHVCYAQHVRREDGDVFDPRNAMTLCASCHARHHRRGRVLPISALPDAALAFGFDLLGAYVVDYLRRYYRDDGDSRLVAMEERSAA